MNWLTSPHHFAWLANETQRLLDFGTAARHPDGGFGWLDDAGGLDRSRDVELWITCRMTHCFALAAMMGDPEAGALVDHGLDALQGRLRDDEHGGWFAAVGPKGPTNDRKEAYGHAFVILAAASAMAAGRDGAHELLTDAIAVHTERFWDEREGMARESFTADWSEAEDYRGVNANMHTVEAYIAAADVVGDGDLLSRALRITSRVISVYAQAHAWRIPEHFSADWDVDLELNKDNPADPFRPYGSTIGHGLEWARLTLVLSASLQQVGLAAPPWMVPAARSLYDRAVADGWQVDGEPGFVYTVDWDGEPVVHERMHWVAAEAIAAAACLYSATKAAPYAQDYRRWWEYAAQFHRDRAAGSWLHELDRTNEPSATVWHGKPDIYHAVQACLMPRLPLTPSFAAAIAQGRLA